MATNSETDARSADRSKHRFWPDGATMAIYLWPHITTTPMLPTTERTVYKYSDQWRVEQVTRDHFDRSKMAPHTAIKLPPEARLQCGRWFAWRPTGNPDEHEVLIHAAIGRIRVERINCGTCSLESAMFFLDPNNLMSLMLLSGMGLAGELARLYIRDFYSPTAENDPTRYTLPELGIATHLVGPNQWNVSFNDTVLFQGGGIDGATRLFKHPAEAILFAVWWQYLPVNVYDPRQRLKIPMHEVVLGTLAYTAFEPDRMVVVRDDGYWATSQHNLDFDKWAEQVRSTLS